MSQELLEQIYAISVSVLNNFQMVLCMLLVVMIASCFLGRYVVLSRKHVLSACGILAFSVIGTIVSAVAFGEKVDQDVMFMADNIITILVFIYSFVFYLFAFKEKRIIRALEATLCFYLSTLYISTFSQMSVLYFSGGTEKVMYDIFFERFAVGALWFVIAVTGFLITLALFVMVYLGFYKPRKSYTISIPARILFVVWVTAFTVFPWIPAMLRSDDFPIERCYNVMSVMFAIGLILLGLAVPVIMVIASAERSMRARNKYQETYIAAELEYIEQYKRKQVETQAFRHDIKNNLAMTQMMMTEGHNDEAREHISDMLGKVSALSPEYVTGDEMLDIIVSMKADRMRELGIRFTMDGVVDGGLNIKPMDMCGIFANALDNAIEAASSAGCDEPYVLLGIKRTDKFFVIKITNSAAGKVDAGKILIASGYTSKKDKDHHGFGLMNARRTVERYNGMLKASSEEGSFTLSIILPRER